MTSTGFAKDFNWTRYTSIHVASLKPYGNATKQTPEHHMWGGYSYVFGKFLQPKSLQYILCFPEVLGEHNFIVGLKNKEKNHQIAICNLFAMCSTSSVTIEKALDRVSKAIFVNKPCDLFRKWVDRENGKLGKLAPD